MSPRVFRHTDEHNEKVLTRIRAVARVRMQNRRVEVVLLPGNDWHVTIKTLVGRRVMLTEFRLSEQAFGGVLACVDAICAKRRENERTP